MFESFSMQVKLRMEGVVKNPLWDILLENNSSRFITSILTSTNTTCTYMWNVKVMVNGYTKAIFGDEGIKNFDKRYIPILFVSNVLLRLRRICFIITESDL